MKADGYYLITGGLGGFGKVLAEWLVDCGAKHLVLTGRSGASTPEAEEFLVKTAGPRSGGESRCVPTPDRRRT